VPKQKQPCTKACNIRKSSQNKS